MARVNLKQNNNKICIEKLYCYNANLKLISYDCILLPGFVFFFFLLINNTFELNFKNCTFRDKKTQDSNVDPRLIIG